SFEHQAVGHAQAGDRQPAIRHLSPIADAAFRNDPTSFMMDTDGAAEESICGLRTKRCHWLYRLRSYRRHSRSLARQASLRGLAPVRLFLLVSCDLDSDSLQRRVGCLVRSNSVTPCQLLPARPALFPL